MECNNDLFLFGCYDIDALLVIPVWVHEFMRNSYTMLVPRHTTSVIVVYGQLTADSYSMVTDWEHGSQTSLIDEP